ncbi:hypothetical protein BC829DRAFT_1967 [Chytridium lagenaria]|nr:hypothetical protein BC829DRAFT_1967 [Chytridium lagenaria]
MKLFAPTEAWIADETASQIVGPDTEDTGAEGDVEELRGLSEDTLRMNDMSRESSFGFLNERDIRQIRDEMGRAKKESSRAPARSRADSQAASSKRSRVPIWKDTTALSSDPRTRDYARTTTRTRSKSEGVRRRSRSPISKDRQDGRGREMPFIVGTNAGKSYSVTANLQQVFSLLKSHNPLLCTVCNKRENMYREDPDFLHKDEHHCDLHSHDEGPEDEERRGNLQSILSYLEDEFRALRSKYNSLVVKYEAEARDSALALAEGKGYPRRSQRLKDIGDELKEVIQDMSVKGEQIDIMKDVVLSSTRHFETYHSRKRATSPTPAARRHRSHSERPQRERSTTRPSTPHRPASRPMEPRERSSTMPVKRPQPRPSTPFSTSRSPTFLSNRPSSPLVTAIPTYPRHRSPLSGGGWTRNGEDPRPFSRIGPKGGYVGVGLTSSTFTPFAVPKAKPVEIDMTDRGRRMSGGRRRSSSHAPSLGDGVSPFERARSISPSRAVASLSLLKSSLKVQEALVEART